VDPGKLLPHATVYVHVSQESFLRGTGGVARFENGIGPVTLEQAIEFLGHRRVSIKPVIDLARQVPVDAYEVPARLREAVRLARPASVFPYSGSTGPSMDLDHTVPYLPPSRGGPPGQTGLHNLAPLSRFEHRVKTHARGWVHYQPQPGVYLWRSRYGYWYRVDPTGTHPLGKHPDPAAHQPTRPIVPALAGGIPAAGSPLDAAFARLINA
jgi:hypothetical protein